MSLMFRLSKVVRVDYCMTATTWYTTVAGTLELVEFVWNVNARAVACDLLAG